jgi:streptogramin lyase
VTGVVDLGPDASYVAVAGSDVWVAADTGTLTRFSPRGAVLQTLRLGRPVSGMAALDGRLWIGLR